MKNLVIGLLISVFFLTACEGTPPLTQPTPASSIDNPTFTPSATPTTSVTPLPTIPTFTPTFDVSMILTVTPAMQAECLVQNNRTIEFIPFDEQKIPNILEALNQGVPLATVLKAIEKGAKLYYSDLGLKDLPEVYVPPMESELTNDGNPEIIIPNGEGANLVYYVLGCENQKYDVLFSIDNEGMYYTNLQFVNDANRNGLPETLFSEGRCDFGGCGGKIKVIEWNGTEMKTVLDEEELGTYFESILIEDLDKDGLMEFLWSGNIPTTVSLSGNGPWRYEKHAYKWNGIMFAPLPIEYDTPEYRFQALQDADRYALESKYDTALPLYQDVIFSDKLSWWSPDRYNHQFEIVIAINNNLSTPTLIPPDSTEYPRLAAYAYYRIMLLHLVQGQESEATVTYTTLQQTFGDDPYARPYAEMASVFWEAYQSTQRMYDGCAAAIQYAAEHPEILTPLGSDYHGAQSHTYIPADVCPFR